MLVEAFEYISLENKMRYVSFSSRSIALDDLLISQLLFLW